MLEKPHEPVSVLAAFSHTSEGSVRVVPWAMQWQGRRYALDTMGLYHPEKRGNKYIHIFSFSSGPSAFRLELDPETLEWTLAEVYYDN